MVQFLKTEGNQSVVGGFQRGSISKVQRKGKKLGLREIGKGQTKGSVEEFIQEFELLVSQAPNIMQEQLLGYFLAGLQVKIRNQIRPHNPKELMRAMEIALDLGENGTMEKGGGMIQQTSQSHYHGRNGGVNENRELQGGARGCRI